ncbi:hypothetical protein LOK49_LG08G02643 [Camellia lanceoleosa]|uniref:Uncharacterized protein n=1 Tax=Camellia lanceoleosa TaxID=1840588 RepID=A0ACC0GU13_9ERIC|nr:hypothetical protein LOK49_LG08G02643 [Camellia lanceoleosa]
MNQKHKNDAKNRALQNILFTMLQQEDEAKAKQSLITLYDLHRRKVWFDDRTANAICTACFHPSSRIRIAALPFLLDYENIEDDDDSDSDGSSSEDDSATQQPQVVSREAMYKAHHKGTSSSRKKKKAKLQRAIRSMKSQKRMSSEKSNLNYYSPLSHLKDAQIKMMMLKVIARTVGLHRLILLNFYPYLQKYVQPHQRDVTTLLNAVREICLRMPLVLLTIRYFDKLSKEERLELIRARREERGKYQARAAVKQKKTGGSSNQQKEHKKAMPLAAKRSKVARSKQEKKKKQQRSSKQFCGRKAWK